MFPSRAVADGPVCYENNPDLWFDKATKDEAIRLCGRCDLRAECLVQSFKDDGPDAAWAVWAGMVPAKRRKIKLRYGIVTVSHARALLDPVE